MFWKKIVTHFLADRILVKKMLILGIHWMDSGSIKEIGESGE